MFKLSLQLNGHSPPAIRERRGSTGSRETGPSLHALRVAQRVWRVEGTRQEREPASGIERVKQKLLETTRDFNFTEVSERSRVRASDIRRNNQGAHNEAVRIVTKLERDTREKQGKETLDGLSKEAESQEIDVYRLSGFLNTVLGKVESKYYEMLQSGNKNLDYVERLDQQLGILKAKILNLLGYEDLEKESFNSLKGVLFQFLEKLKDRINELDRIDPKQFEEVIGLLTEVNILL